MSKYYVYANENSGYEPYQPLSNVDSATGEKLNDPVELRRRVGPFFVCKNETNKPHFHVVTNHPDIDGQLPDDIIMHQLHVPGFDQHNGKPKKGFATMPAFDIATGYHFVDPKNIMHMSEWREDHKFPAHVDNQDAFKQWREKSEAMFGKGGVRSEEDGTYSFFPGLTDEDLNKKQEDQEEPEELEEQEEEQEEPEQEEHKFCLEPGQTHFNIVFHPGREPKDPNQPYYPAFARSRVLRGHNNASETQNELLQNANTLGLVKQMQDIKNLGADADYWNELSKRSHKNWDLWS